MHTKESILSAIQAIRMSSGIKRIVQDVINELPDESEVVEVYGCEGCVFHKKILGQGERYHECFIPSEKEYANSADNIYDLFATCPVKTKAITIKLKEYEQH